MRLKACKHCGQTFETDKPGAYLCPDCAAESRRRSVYRERVCIDCGASFMGYPKSKRCPDCQGKINRARNAQQKQRGPVRPLGSTDICQNCGKEYIVEVGRQRYCKECSAQAVHSNIKSHKRDYMASYSSEHQDEKEANRSFNKVCLICGKIFDSDKPTVTCSPECSKRLATIRNNESMYRSGKRKTPPDQKYESGLPKSGIVGVTARRNGKWSAVYKSHYIGIFDTIEAAAQAIEDYKTSL
jgi:DNA-directed RNA polymerase subunit RPC12/RpoP